MLPSGDMAPLSLGLPAQPGKGQDLTEVPPDLDPDFSSVRQARVRLVWFCPSPARSPSKGPEQAS